MYKSYSIEIAGRTLTADIGRVCAQANGAAITQTDEIDIIILITQNTSLS